MEDITIRTLISALVVLAIIGGTIGFCLLTNFCLERDLAADYSQEEDVRLPIPYRSIFKDIPVGFVGALAEGPKIVGYFRQSKGEPNVNFVVYHEGHKIIGNFFGKYGTDWKYLEEPTINVYFDRWPKQVFNQKCHKLYSWGDSGYYCSIGSFQEFAQVVKKLGGTMTKLTPQN